MSGTMTIAMWSGPRNISTAMMRSFANRSDTFASDEPFYAAYLAATGLAHPMRAEILAAQPNDWRDVAAHCAGPAPGGKAIWYQKHMSHHMLPGVGLDWAMAARNAFLIRSPEAVLASYVEKRGDVTLEDIGLPQQVALFERLAHRNGAAPPVVEANDVLADPRGVLAALCRAFGIAFDAAMLSWPSGPHPSDGVWAPAWYDKVVQSTGFGPPREEIGFEALADRLKRIAVEARPLYERLRKHRLAA